MEACFLLLAKIRIMGYWHCTLTKLLTIRADIFSHLHCSAGFCRSDSSHSCPQSWDTRPPFQLYAPYNEVVTFGEIHFITLSSYLSKRWGAYTSSQWPCRSLECLCLRGTCPGPWLMPLFATTVWSFWLVWNTPRKVASRWVLLVGAYGGEVLSRTSGKHQHQEYLRYSSMICVILIIRQLFKEVPKLSALSQWHVLCSPYLMFPRIAPKSH